MIPNQSYVFLNGHFCRASEAHISIHDRGFLFGEGVFTTICLNQGNCELWPLHLKRLHEQAKILNFNCPDFLEASIAKLIQLNHAQTGMWRLKIILTALTTLITLKPVEIFKTPITLAIYPFAVERPCAEIKSLAYLDSLFIQQFGQKSHCADALICNAQGFILETGSANIFWIYENVCYLPDFALPYLKGVVLQALLNAITFPIQYIYCTVDQIPSDACVYICNAIKHIQPVVAIGNRLFKRQILIENRLNQAFIQALQMNS